MPSWIVLIRGINVGGRVLPMARLVDLVAKAGCTNIRTYIQSGNVVCTSPLADGAVLGERIGKAILASEGYEPAVMTLSRDELAAAVAGNPYPTTVPKELHLFFLAAPPPDPSLAALAPYKLPTEHYTLRGRTLYLHATSGFGTSKLAAKFEKLAKVSATARNWATVTALLALADAAPAPKKSAPKKRVPKKPAPKKR